MCRSHKFRKGNGGRLTGSNSGGRRFWRVIPTLDAFPLPLVRDNRGERVEFAFLR